MAPDIQFGGRSVYNPNDISLEHRIARAYERWQKRPTREHWSIFSRLHRMRSAEMVERLEHQRGLR
jgi:hypothetical protein